MREFLELAFMGVVLIMAEVLVARILPEYINALVFLIGWFGCIWCRKIIIKHDHYRH